MRGKRAVRNRLLIKRLNRTLELDRQRKAVAVYFFADWHLDPAFADAVRLYVKALFAVKAYAYRVLKNRSVVVRAAGVSGQLVWQIGA